jgi:hypothetical protein
MSMAQCWSTSTLAAPSVCSLIARPPPSPRGAASTRARRWSAGIAPAPTPRAPGAGHPTRSRWPTGGIEGTPSPSTSKRLLAAHQGCLRQREDIAPEGPPESGSAAALAEAAEAAQAQPRGDSALIARTQARYQAVHTLNDHGKGVKTITRERELAKETARRSYRAQRIEELLAKPTPAGPASWTPTSPTRMHAERWHHHRQHARPPDHRAGLPRQPGHRGRLPDTVPWAQHRATAHTGKCPRPTGSPPGYCATPRTWMPRNNSTSSSCSLSARTWTLPPPTSAPSPRCSPAATVTAWTPGGQPSTVKTCPPAPLRHRTQAHRPGSPPRTHTVPPLRDRGRQHQPHQNDQKTAVRPHHIRPAPQTRPTHRVTKRTNSITKSRPDPPKPPPGVGHGDWPLRSALRVLH